MANIKIPLIFKSTAILFLCWCSLNGCKKFVEAKPPITSVNAGNVYLNDNTATSVLTAIYAQLAANAQGSGSYTGMPLYTGLLSDELELFNPNDANYLPYYKNTLNAISYYGNPSFFWSTGYKNIYAINAALEGVAASESLSSKTKQQLLGEARFMRAFFYFYLVNLFGDVPLALSTDYRVNSVLPRSPQAKVYQQIIDDLKEAKTLLSDDYLDIGMNTTIERIRPNRAAATAFLARVYLYTEDYAGAETEASEVIANTNYQLEDLNNAFLKTSRETIWSLQPVINNYNTWEGRVFPLPSAGPNVIANIFYLSNQLVSKFETGDNRLTSWIGNVTADGKTYYYDYKYKVNVSTTNITEYEVVLRLSELYLIRAEARAKLNKLSGSSGAENDLNIIRSRAGLSPTTASSQSEFLDATLHERQTELFLEWGHRWFDLKRIKKIDEVMSVVYPLKNATWEPFKALFPIDQYQLNLNPAMKGQQNPGY